MISEIIDHIVWPITVIILAIMFYQPIRLLLKKLRKVDWGKKSAEFDTEADFEKVEEVKKAVETNDVADIHRIVGQPAMRLLLALSGRNESMPLTIYKAPAFDIAKRNILRLGLAYFQDGRFTITELGLKVAKQQIEDRLKIVKR
jgi:hypothetical protein